MIQTSQSGGKGMSCCSIFRHIFVTSVSTSISRNVWHSNLQGETKNGPIPFWSDTVLWISGVHRLWQTAHCEPLIQISCWMNCRVFLASWIFFHCNQFHTNTGKVTWCTWYHYSLNTSYQFIHICTFQCISAITFCSIVDWAVKLSVHTCYDGTGHARDD